MVEINGTNKLIYEIMGCSFRSVLSFVDSKLLSNKLQSYPNNSLMRTKTNTGGHLGSFTKFF